MVEAVQAIVDDPLMRHSAILVFANKQDMVRFPACRMCFCSAVHAQWRGCEGARHIEAAPSAPTVQHAEDLAAAAFSLSPGQAELCCRSKPWTQPRCARLWACQS